MIGSRPCLTRRLRRAVKTVPDSLFIAGHPGTTDEDMLNLALWLKADGFRADQVQNFYPTPMATATAMYYSESDPFTVLIETVRQCPLLDTEVSDALQSVLAIPRSRQLADAATSAAADEPNGFDRQHPPTPGTAHSIFRASR